MPTSIGAALLDIFAQGEAAERAVLSKRDHSTSIIFFLELPGEGDDIGFMGGILGGKM